MREQEVARSGGRVIGPMVRVRILLAIVAILLVGCGSSADSEPAAVSESRETVVSPAAPIAPIDAAATAMPEPGAQTMASDVDLAEPPTVTPMEQPNSDPALRSELSNAFDDWFAGSSAPGAALAVQLFDGELLEFTAGTADLRTGEPVDADGVFRIASISKSFTAATMMDLAQDGLVDLDAPVTEYLGSGWVGDHANADEITVRQLLGHTSGLVEYAFHPAFGVEALGRYGQPWAPADILDFVGRQGAEFAPGAAFSYNTGGFIAAGLIIEKVTGESATDVMQRRLFGPAGATTIGLPPDHPLSDDHVSGYVDGGFAHVMISADPLTDEGLTLPNGTPVVDVLTPDQASLRTGGWTGGGVEATMGATAAVWHAMFDGTLLGPDAVKELLTPLTSTPYGLGVRIGTVADARVYSHSGGTAGFRSEAGYIDGIDASFAMSANTSASGNGIETLARQVIAILVANQATG